MKVSSTTAVLCAHLDEKFHYPIETCLRKCREAGFTAMDMNSNAYSCSGGPLTKNDWQDWAYSVRETADKLGISFTQSHIHFYRTIETQQLEHLENRSWREEMIRRSIITAGILGSRWNVLHPLDYDENDTELSDKAATERNLAYWTPFCELAERNHIGIAIEYMIPSKRAKRFCANPYQLAELIDAFHAPRTVGACLDTGHCHLTEFTEREAILTLGSRLHATHIDDNHGAGGKDEHLLPFYGTIDWDEVVTALKEIHYSGDFTFEVAHFTNPLPDEMAFEMAGYLKRLGEYLIRD